jgi:hypothetical protein
VFLAIHDALVKDLLDKAERAATGRLAHAARWPPWLPLANRIEVALRPRRGRLAAVTVPAALLGIAVDFAGGIEGPYEPLDLVVYSPTALAIGLGTAWLLRTRAEAGTPAVLSPFPKKLSEAAS